MDQEMSSQENAKVKKWEDMTYSERVSHFAELMDKITGENGYLHKHLVKACPNAILRDDIA